MTSSNGKHGACARLREDRLIVNGGQTPDPDDPEASDLEITSDSPCAPFAYGDRWSPSTSTMRIGCGCRGTCHLDRTTMCTVTPNGKTGTAGIVNTREIQPIALGASYARQRLRDWTVHVPEFRDPPTNYSKWFQHVQDDSTFPTALTEVVTEFGMYKAWKLDMPIVGWGTDMIWDG